MSNSLSLQMEKSGCQIISRQLCDDKLSYKGQLKRKRSVHLRIFLSGIFFLGTWSGWALQKTWSLIILCGSELAKFFPVKDFFLP